MDLSIIREELKGDNYESPHEFWKDLKIMFNNAKNYTPNKRTRVCSIIHLISFLCIKMEKELYIFYHHFCRYMP